jgi:hypothetical protein
MNAIDRSKAADAGVGEPITMEDGVTIQAVEDPEYRCCERCYFNDFSAVDLDFCEGMPCVKEDRKDRKNIRFVKVES